MDKEKLRQLFNKNKNMQTLYIILIIGIVIFLFANTLFSNKNDKKINETESFCSLANINLQNELEQILSKIDGVGSVNVMLTYDTTGEKHYAVDTTSENNNVGTQGEKTQAQNRQTKKIVTASNEPIMIKQTLPKVLGVIVVCDGGADIQIKADVTNALKAVLNIADHKIGVFAKK